MKRLIGLLAVVILMASLVPATAAQAATIDRAHVKCSRARVVGNTDVDAPFVRAQIFNASNLTQPLATVIVPVKADGSYRLSMTYAKQPKNTRLILAVGEWDGTQYLQPATLIGKDCFGH